MWEEPYGHGTMWSTIIYVPVQTQGLGFGHRVVR